MAMNKAFMLLTLKLQISENMDDESVCSGSPIFTLLQIIRAVKRDK
jgi:hypothetical protein